MAGFVRKRFGDIVSRMIQWVTTYSTKLTDFNTGSATRTMLEAVAWVVEDLYEDLFLGFREMVRLFIYDLFAFRRKDAVKSGGSVVFSRNVADPSVIDIPIGTIVETTDGVQFETTENATIAASATDSAATAIRALVAGTSGDVPAHTITNMVTDVAGVDAVDNSADTGDGRDRESDTDLQVRFRKFVTNLAKTTKYGLEAGAEQVQGVYQAKIVEHPTTRGHLYLYIDDGSGSAGSALLTAVRAKIEGSGIAIDPGWRGAGTFIEYLSASAVLVNITQTLFLVSGADAAAVLAAVESAQASYVNQHRMGVDVVKEQLKHVAKKNPDVRDISMTIPAGNTAVADGQVAKIGTITTATTDFVDA